MAAKRKYETFMVNITPKRARNSDPPIILTLAPFSIVPKVNFQDVTVGSQASSTIIVRNPSTVSTEIEFDVCDELLKLGVTFNSNYFKVDENSESFLEISWTPKKVIQWRGKIPVKHLNGNKKFVPVVIGCSSVSPPTKKQKIPPKTPQKFKRSPRSFNDAGMLPAVPFFDTPRPQKDFTRPSTSIRRETYEVVEPKFVFNVAGLSPCSHKANESTVQFLPFHRPPVTSSPRKNDNLVKENREPLRDIKEMPEIKENREPLKEVHFNSINLNFNELKSTHIKKVDFSTDSIISDRNFDRDSLDPPLTSPVIQDTSSSLFVMSPFVLKHERMVSDVANEEHQENSQKGSPTSLLVRQYFSPSNIMRSLDFQFNTPVSPSNGNLESVEGHQMDILESESTYFVSEEGSTGSHQPVYFLISPVRAAPQNRDAVCGMSGGPEWERPGPSLVKKKQPITTSVATNKGFTQIKEENLILYNKSDYVLNPYGITNISDPFSKHSYYPRELVEAWEVELIKWLNSLLVPPKEFGSMVEGVDVKLVWDKSTTAPSLKVAPSRELASREYHQSGHHMLALRKAAFALYTSHTLQETLLKIKGKIQSGFLSVKNEMSIHHDQGGRVKLVQMIMYYNPLWLRVGLEVMFNCEIPVTDNNVHSALIQFLKIHFLSDSNIIAKNPKACHLKLAAFNDEMNNYIVLRFLTLIFFLDQAKIKKLIPYDPCLFCKNSPIKDSEEMLNEFIKEFLKCVGKMKKTLKHLGYCLIYKQTYLNEFDYGLSSHLELRDGVRLARVMDIILKDHECTHKLWTPATSRVQKLHNVQVALSALTAEGYQISDDIGPNDIVAGHREKTYSLLWQILHKFLAPRYLASAVCIQRWWKKQQLKIVVDRKIRDKKQKRLSDAALRIQSFWRGYQVRSQFSELRQKLVERKQLRNTSANIIKKWYRNLKLARECRESFLKKKNSAIVLQRWCRNVQQTKSDRGSFVKTKKATIVIQRWYRAILLGRQQRSHFLLLKSNCIKIQGWHRSIKEMKSCRNNFIDQRRSAKVIQNWYRSYLFSRQNRSEFLKKREAILSIQKWYRNVLLTRRTRADFIMKKEAVIRIQCWYRGAVLSNMVREEFLTKKKFAITIQSWYRSCVETRLFRRQFLEAKHAVHTIQDWYRSCIYTKKISSDFKKKKNSVVVIQQWYRSILVMRECREKYNNAKKSAIKIQVWFRSVIVVRRERNKFILLRESTVKVQAWYRAIQESRRVRNEFEKKKSACIQIQRFYRRYKEVKLEHQNYIALRQATIKIQKWYRGVRAVKEERDYFLKLKKIVQRIEYNYFAKKERENFIAERRAAVKIQRWYRSILQTRQNRKKFMEKRNAAVLIKRWFRRNRERREQKKMQTLHQAATRIQALWRGYLLRKKQEIVSRKTRKPEATKQSSTLGTMLDNNLHTVENDGCKSLHIWLIVLTNIDVATMYSSLLCIRVASHALFLKSVWEFLDVPSRSGLFLKAFDRCLNILIRLSKVPDTRPFVIESARENCACHTLITLMGKSIEKNTTIFCKSVTVLWILLCLSPPVVQRELKASLDLQRLRYYYKKAMSSKAVGSTRAECYIPQFEYDWGYGKNSACFLSVRLSMVHLFKALREEPSN